MTSVFTCSRFAAAVTVSSTPLSTNPSYTPPQRLPLAAPRMAFVHRNHFNFLQIAHQTASLVGDHVAFAVGHVSEQLNGYFGRFSAAAVAELRSLPEVDFVERDQVARVQETQKSAPWGLARLSHRVGVDVYVLDDIHSPEFQGRASWGATFREIGVDTDGNGHGTHCAGTIASHKYSVAKRANVSAVKVLGSDGNGPLSDVVGGVEFATKVALKNTQEAETEVKATGKTAHKGSVANMSLGNDNRDACDYSPAAAESAVTVGASTISDERAYFSNHGLCVDVFAPGLNILSTWIGGAGAVNTISGTSMAAAPHVAGLLAYLLSLYPSKSFNPKIATPHTPARALQRPFSIATMYAYTHAALPAAAPAPASTPARITPMQLKRALIRLATRGVLSNVPAGTPNLLIFNNATGL
ncbi:peptidase S8/S53 domain-containing protein [Mycena pura]|uniref:Peptidase S8/S53 domain-containing protein n=1 Tax=Mycena pura TaxID=153505 RepID=A0AAD6VQ50_9AGAR|nr:peptidase S8/S53 domain-containing protein [Mycena pura]